MTDTLARWQPEYAARGVSLFPVSIDNGSKRPAVRNYLRLGDRASRNLARGRYGECHAFGFAAGQRSKITVLDVDSKDERELADAMSRHGESPFIVRSVSGHYQAYYRWSGERRRIRPMAGKPVDILGGGFAVAPPSQSQDGRGYQIIAGTLDDLARLPPLKGGGVAVEAALEHMGEASGRNETLFRLLGRQVRACDDLGALLDVAAAINSEFGVPLDPKEVERTARSVWKMEAEGRNRFGRHGAWFEADELSRLMVMLSPQALGLLAFVKANNGPASQFIVADAMRGRAEFSSPSWSHRDLPRARRELVNLGIIVPLTKKAPGQAVKYAWGDLPRGGAREVSIEDIGTKALGVCQSGKTSEHLTKLTGVRSAPMAASQSAGPFKTIGQSFQIGKDVGHLPKLVGDADWWRDRAKAVGR